MQDNKTITKHDYRTIKQLHIQGAKEKTAQSYQHLVISPDIEHILLGRTLSTVGSDFIRWRSKQKQGELSPFSHPPL